MDFEIAAKPAPSRQIPQTMPRTAVCFNGTRISLPLISVINAPEPGCSASRFSEWRSRATIHTSSAAAGAPKRATLFCYTVWPFLAFRPFNGATNDVPLLHPANSSATPVQPAAITKADTMMGIHFFIGSSFLPRLLRPPISPHQGQPPSLICSCTVVPLCRLFEYAN